MQVVLRMMQPNSTVLMLFHLDNLGVQFKCSSLGQQNSLIINHNICIMPQHFQYLDMNKADELK